MLRQAQLPEEKETLWELQKALTHENTALALERHTDDTLIQLLHRLQLPSKIISRFQTILKLIVMLIYIGIYFDLWSLPIIPILVCFVLFIFPIDLYFKINPEVLEQVNQRLGQASLQTLLEAYTLNIPELKRAIFATLPVRLSIATTEDLEALTPEHRKQLVRFTLECTRPDLATYTIGRFISLSDDRTSAATAGFLALASLKQPGAERVSLQWMRTKNPNLKRAVEEYKLAMKATE